MKKPYWCEAMLKPLRINVRGPSHALIGTFAGVLAEHNATTICDSLNRAYEQGMAAGMLLKTEAQHTGGY